MTQANAAFIAANSAGIYANGAFAQSNIALTQANAAFLRANGSLNVTLGGTVSANLVISGANLVVTNGATQLFNVRSWGTTGYISTSNSTGTVQVIGGVGVKGNVHADGIYDNGFRILIQANAAFEQANIALIRSDAAFAQANIALTQANSAFLFQNATASAANSGFIQANAAFIHANSGFARANFSFIQANAAFIHANSGFIQANAAFNAVNTYIQIPSPYELDDVSRLTNGIRTVFPIQYALSNVTIGGSFNLFVEVNGNSQPSFANTYDVTWQSQVFAMNKGYTITSDGQIKFILPPRLGSEIFLRYITGTELTTPRRYPFKPLDVLMGY